MKKVLIGCGIGCGAVLLIGLLVVGYAGWRFNQFANELGEQMVEIGDRVEQLNTQFPFTPPEDGLVESDRMDAWLQIRSDLGEHGNELAVTFEDLSSANWLALLPTMKDEFIGLANDGVDAFQTAAMSLEEYKWIRGQVIGVLANDDARAKPEMNEMVEAFDKVDRRIKSGPEGESIVSMSTPVTTEQIEHMCALLEERKKAFLESINMFQADLVLNAIAKRMSEFVVPEKEQQ